MIPASMAPQVYALKRIVFGLMFLSHGLQKVFGIFGGLALLCFLSLSLGCGSASKARAVVKGKVSIGEKHLTVEMIEGVTEPTSGVILFRGQPRDRSFRDQGITFSLSGQERPFPLDIVPRLIEAEQWDVVDRGVQQRVKALELKGVAFLKESRRYYPKKELAAHVLGYVGVDNTGLAGLESTYDAQVRGRGGVVGHGGSSRWGHGEEVAARPRDPLAQDRALHQRRLDRGSGPRILRRGRPIKR